MGDPKSLLTLTSNRFLRSSDTLSRNAQSSNLSLKPSASTSTRSIAKSLKLRRKSKEADQLSGLLEESYKINVNLENGRREFSLRLDNDTDEPGHQSDGRSVHEGPDHEHKIEDYIGYSVDFGKQRGTMGFAFARSLHEKLFAEIEGESDVTGDLSEKTAQLSMIYPRTAEVARHINKLSFKIDRERSKLEGSLEKLCDIIIASTNKIEIYFQDIQLKSFEIPHVSKLIQSLQNLRYLGLANTQIRPYLPEICESILINDTIKTLDLSQNHLKDEDMIPISNMIKVTNTLLNLYLNSNDITDVGADILGAAMMVNDTMEKLHLRDNCIRHINHLFN